MYYNLSSRRVQMHQTRVYRCFKQLLCVKYQMKTNSSENSEYSFLMNNKYYKAEARLSQKILISIKTIFHSQISTMVHQYQILRKSFDLLHYKAKQKNKQKDTFPLYTRFLFPIKQHLHRKLVSYFIFVSSFKENIFLFLLLLWV